MTHEEIIEKIRETLSEIIEVLERFDSDKILSSHVWPKTKTNKQDVER